MKKIKQDNSTKSNLTKKDPKKIQPLRNLSKGLTRENEYSNSEKRESLRSNSQKKGMNSNNNSNSRLIGESDYSNSERRGSLRSNHQRIGINSNNNSNSRLLGESDYSNSERRGSLRSNSQKKAVNFQDQFKVKSIKKLRDTEMEIEEKVEEKKRNSSIQKKDKSDDKQPSSLQKKSQKAENQSIGITAKNNKVSLEVEENDKLALTGSKKRRVLTKIGDKQKANSKVTKKQKVLIQSEESEEEEVDEESSQEEKGTVEFVDDKIIEKGHQRIDDIFKKVQGKNASIPQKKKDNSSIVNLESFLPKPMKVETQQKDINQQSEERKQSSDEELNSDEEELRRLESLQNQRKNGKSNQQQETVIMQAEKQNINKLQQLSLIDEEIPEQQVQSKKRKNSPQKPNNSSSSIQQIQGKTFVINGSLEKISKLELENSIKSCGGLLKALQYSKPGYMILGKQMKEVLKQKAENNGSIIYSEEQFISMILNHLSINSVEQLNEKYKTQIDLPIHSQQQNESNHLNNKSVSPPKKNSLLETSDTAQEKKQNKVNSITTNYKQIPPQNQNKPPPNKNKPIQDSANLSFGLEQYLPMGIIKSEAPKKQQLVAQEKSEIKTQEIEIEIQQPEYSQSQPNKKEEVKGKTFIPTKKNPKEIPETSESHTYELWTHKYQPKQLEECVGNFRAIQKAQQWLINWENVVIHKMKIDSHNWKDNLTARACLISGPPGIGKTSTVRLLAKSVGMNIIEWNASDVRNKKAIESFVNPLKDNQVINFDGYSSQPQKQRSIILMDEIDGMSSGDIGGNQTLIKIIKETQNPIFCVCNDRFSQKLRSLAASCLDVRFERPRKEEVAQRLLKVCTDEGITSNIKTLEMLSESANSDIRQSLNLMQMYSRKTKEINYTSFKEGISSFKKDNQVQLNIFEATKKLINRVEFQNMEMGEKLDLFFLDYEMLPLLIQENYLLNVKVQNQKTSSIEELETVATASLAFAESDILGQSIRSKGNWSLLIDQGFLTSAYIPEKACHKVGGYPQMTQFLGKMSSQRKTNRIIRELRMKMAENISGNRMATQMDYAKPLMEMILHNLEFSEKGGIETVINIMGNYNITPDILKEHLVILQYSSVIDERLKKIPSTIKSALTKAYNKRFKDDVKIEKKKVKADEDINSVDVDHHRVEEIEEESLEIDIQSQQDEDEQEENRQPEQKSIKLENNKNNKIKESAAATKQAKKTTKEKPSQQNTLKFGKK